MVKKQLIMDKALELFAEQGFESTSVQQITERCGISKGAFYLSFKSKDELIFSLIDHFMMQINANIDSSVKNCKNKDQMLYEFYFTMFRSFKEHYPFAKILMKEQTQNFNKELLSKHNFYDNQINETILFMIDQLYSDDVKKIKYDLLICIKGFMKIPAELYLRFDLPLDLDLLTKSIVEKTNILAQHSSIPFISEEDMHKVIHNPMCKSSTITKEQISSLIKLKIHDIDHPIEKESLEILSENLFHATTSMAITKGLLENIKNNPDCKWISYLICEHYKIN